MKSSPCRTAVRTVATLAGFSLALAVSAQESPKPLSATEAYLFALAPYNATRNQSNDLTEADKLALGIGIARAAEHCAALSADLPKLSQDPQELFALIQLCNFGRQYEPARAAAVRYLALEKPPLREQAFALLARAYLGLGEPGMAEPQVRSMMLDHPYDAAIHATLRTVVDALEGLNPNYDRLAMELCDAEREATLPLLAQGKSLADKENSFAPAALFADAVACAALARGLHKPDGMEKLQAIADLPNWQGTADGMTIASALERQQMAGKPSPLESLRGILPGSGSLVARTVNLRRGTVLLLPFTLWSPSALEMAADLAQLTPRQTIYALTSWRANTGGEDKPSREVAEKLRQWQRGLPRTVSILIVPDTVLSGFHCDAFPAGILIRDGLVEANLPLNGRGAQRLLVRTIAKQR
jgi:hypothetical protein